MKFIKSLFDFEFDFKDDDVFTYYYYYYYNSDQNVQQTTMKDNLFKLFIIWIDQKFI